MGTVQFICCARMPLAKYRHIVVEGPIGVGKTSLARRLAPRLGSNLPPDRPNQRRERAQPDLFNRVTVSDFLLDKDPLFARLTLSSDEWRLYQQIFEALQPQAPKPDLGGSLQAQPE